MSTFAILSILGMLIVLFGLTFTDTADAERMFSRRKKK